MDTLKRTKELPMTVPESSSRVYMVRTEIEGKNSRTLQGLFKDYFNIFKDYSQPNTT